MVAGVHGDVEGGGRVEGGSIEGELRAPCDRTFLYVVWGDSHRDLHMGSNCIELNTHTHTHILTLEGLQTW